MSATVRPASSRIGFIGLGAMGMAMARNILKAGYDVRVYDRGTEGIAGIVTEGAVAGASPADVARNSDVVLLSLPDTSDVESVLFGPDGIAGGGRPGLVVIDTSTILPIATKGFAERLAKIGIDLIDSPVSGDPDSAAAGTLMCMIGGGQAVIEACLPVLQLIGQTHLHMGESGSGQMAKACDQLVGTTFAGVSEAVAMCRKAGVDLFRVREALSELSAETRG